MENASFKTVVVGLDFSDYSKIVARRAIKIAESLHAKLVLVNALSAANYSTGEALCYVPSDDEFSLIAEEMRSFYKTRSFKKSPDIIVEFGNPAELLINIAKKEDRPLIVVGHRGQSKISHFFLGNTAQELSLRAPFPVWVQRGNSTQLPINILIPCDFSARTEKSFDVASRLENGRLSLYEFYHVKHQPVPLLDVSTFKKAEREAEVFEADGENRLREHYRGVPYKSDTGETAPCIERESARFDLIAMAPHNKEGFFSSFGSVTAKVVRTGNVPVLITH